MRISPIGFYANSLEEALKLAKISAEVTHNHPEGIKGAQAVAAITYIMKNASVNDNVDTALEEVKRFVKEHYSYKVEYTEEEWNEYSAKYNFNETCQGSVPEAIYCALSSDSYEQAIRKAVSLGGDADTQAAIAGGIISAYHPVPLSIIAKCLELLPDDLREIINTFNRTLKHD
jgi:ADP-ribosylglycohydrolase